MKDSKYSVDKKANICTDIRHKVQKKAQSTDERHAMYNVQYM